MNADVLKKKKVLLQMYQLHPHGESAFRLLIELLITGQEIDASQALG